LWEMLAITTDSFKFLKEVLSEIQYCNRLTSGTVC